MDGVEQETPVVGKGVESELEEALAETSFDHGALGFRQLDSATVLDERAEPGEVGGNDRG
jgi:hypothetical protein